MDNIRGSRGGGAGGPDPPPVNHKNIGFLSNSGPDPLKITKLPSQHSMLGHHQHAAYSGIWIVPPLIKLKKTKKRKKTVVKAGPPGKIIWIRACTMSSNKKSMTTQLMMAHDAFRDKHAKILQRKVLENSC